MFESCASALRVWVAKMMQRKTLSQFKKCNPKGVSEMETTPRPGAVSDSDKQQAHKCNNTEPTQLKTLSAAHKFLFSFSKLICQRIEAQTPHYL